MKKGRILKASSDDYIKIINIPDDVMQFFEGLQKKYKHDSFIFDLNPLNFDDEEPIDTEITIYDDYVE